MRNFQIIGEAARHVPEEIVARHSGVPWAQMRGMRNVVVHEYSSVRRVGLPRFSGQVNACEDGGEFSMCPEESTLVQFPATAWKLNRFSRKR
ncbi:MAG: DUF86 domain-containing protein [Gemmatimonadetes bacterium]|nr:DUF86 domain-containing protein [Gemmatimonadota bacterium]